MNLLEVEKRSKEYNYSAEVSFIFNDNKEEVLPSEYIEYITVEHDYVNNFYPILKLGVLVSQYLLEKIIQNRKTIKIKLKISNYVIGNDESSGIKYKFIDDIFIPMLEDITSNKDNDQNVENDNMNSVNSINKPTRLFNSIPLSFYMFKEKDIKISNPINNVIIEDANVLDSIAYLINNSQIDKLLLEKPHNNTIYNQLILPPNTIKKSIDHIQEYYGIYTNGVKFYMDFNMTYLISKDLYNPPLEKDEPEKVIINIEKVNTAYTGRDRSFYNKDEKIFYINTFNSCQFKDRKATTNQIMGDNITVVNCEEIESNNPVFYDPKTKKFTINNSNIQKNPKGDKERVIINKNMTSMSNEQLLKEIEDTELEIMMSLTNIDIRFFNIHRKFTLNFLENNLSFKYNGEYLLDKFAYTIKKMTPEKSSLTCYCLFKRIRK